MPESKTRQAAEEKKKAKRHAETLAKREDRKARAAVSQRSWVPPVFISLLVLGMVWLVVFYIAGYRIPVMSSLGNFNILIGMGLMALGFITMTFWK